MERITNYDQHIIRRREMLALTGLERGLVSGWEERGLWQYTGPSGKHRLYTLVDVVSMALAGELCRAGVLPRYAWDAVNANIKHVVAGRIKYIVATQGEHTFSWRGVQTVGDLVAIIEPQGRRTPAPRAVIVLAAGEIRRQLGEAIDQFFAESLPDAEIERRMALNDQEDES